MAETKRKTSPPKKADELSEKEQELLANARKLQEAVNGNDAEQVPVADISGDADGKGDPELSEAIAEHPAEGPKTITIAEERSQEIFDRQTIDETLTGVRKMMSQDKVNLRLAQAGKLDAADKKNHPEQIKRRIRSQRETADMLLELYDDLDPATGLPMPSDLQVVTALDESPGGP